MKFLSIAVLLSATLAAAMPSPNPAPKSKTVAEATLSCSASQSSIHCCQANGNGVKGKGKVVNKGGNLIDMQCSQLIAQVEAQNVAPVTSICSTTVACCVGDGCVAIAN